jgi:hypothetical protein
MFAKILTAALIASTLTSPACARENKLTEAQFAVILDGIIFHGSATCDSTWLDRDGAKKEAKLAAIELARRGDKAFAKLFERGAKDFDKDLHEFGAVKACQRLDQLIDDAAK